MNPLLDSEFLVKLNNDRNRTIYAHVISLNQYEHPIEQLEGVVTAGSITIDGQSAVRRICSLTLSAKNLNINNVYWGLTTKVKIEIGLQNNVDSRYEDIIWFPQGIFILTDFKTTQTINNYTINLSGKDKMCLLNGDVSGNLPAPVRFDSYTDASNQNYTLGENETYYNNFIDDTAAQSILEGFQERYGSDYQFIRGAKKILTLEYIPNGDINGTIQFNSNEEATDITSIMSKKDDKTYDILIGNRDIYGFIVDHCNPGDQFIWTIEQKIPISIIIQEILHQFGQEQYSNIIIKDIDPYGLEMLDSAFEKDLFLLHDGTIYTRLVTVDSLKQNFVLFGSTTSSGGTEITDEVIENDIIFRNYVDEDDTSLIEILSGSTLSKLIVGPTQIIEKNKPEVVYTIQPINQKEVAGYGMTLLVYPDELTGQPGDSITSILDKIVNMLGDYEYFYDLKGQFVFQAKPAYVKTAWNGKIFSAEDNYIEASELTNRVAYTFDDSSLTTQYQNNPNMNNIKNDYIIWGEKKNASGGTVKFHGRYAIENIPLEYTDFNGFTWTSNKTQSLIQAIYEKQEYAIKNYQHIYNYPSGYTPEESGWWEINDWANYYQSIFGIDLSISGNSMNKYHEKYGSDVKQSDEVKAAFEDAFLTNTNLSLPSTGTDVVTLIYSDASKTTISNLYAHGGTCTSHYYPQFMDLRQLKKGWDYTTTPKVESHKAYLIVNNLSPTQKYQLDTGRYIDWGYHPDFTTSFIYRPILPSNIDIYASDIISDIVYKDAYNMNGRKRQYALTEDVDWRHLIHIMADDWYQHHTEDDYEINLRRNNNWPLLNIDLYPYGRTNYEQYYLDFTSVGGWWQNIYDIHSVYLNYYAQHENVLLSDSNAINKNELAHQMIEQEEYLSQFFSGGAYKYWHKDVVENPEKLMFWFDFFKADEMGIGKFAVSVIGDRPKTINDTAIKTIIYRDTPDVIYCSLQEFEVYQKAYVLKDGYKYIIIDENGEGHVADDLIDLLYYYKQLQQAKENNESIEEILQKLSDLGYTEESATTFIATFPQNIKQNFVRSIRSKTVHDQADTMLYQYSYYNDNVNISNVPIYYLQPNTIISTKDELSRVTGYYVMNKINISLAYNGMMQITAIKSPERIY